MGSSRALITAALALNAALAGAGPKELFIPSGRALDRTRAPRLGVVRSRAVDVDLSALAEAAGALPEEGRGVLLNLFDDVVWEAWTFRGERTEHGMTWVGKLAGQPLGDAVVVVYDGIVEGSIVSPEGAYAIDWADGGQVVEQLDDSAFPENGNCFEEVPTGALESQPAPSAASDDGSLIDVLVAYTPAARIAAGGTSQMQAKMQLAVTETNQGYSNSNVIQRLRLVGSTEVPYTEADISTDLYRVTDPSDGYMDGVPVLRDTYKADVVSLIGAGYTSAGACGIAWLMSGNNPAFAPNAYSVVDVTCMTGYYSFGHEIGHNMGLNHARVDPVGTGAYFYSFGYKDPGNAFRTVMAYNCPVDCTRILHFSNPNVSYSSKPTGINCADLSCVVPDTTSAYNALSLNNTRVTVANWRIGQTADLAITKTDGVSSVTPGLPVTYTIQASNSGPSAVTNASVVDTFPASLSSISWTCSSSAGSFCAAASGSGNINQTVSLLVGGSATFVATGTLSLAATGTLVNTAAVSPPSGFVDPDLPNNTATDADMILILADVSVTKTDGLATAVPGQAIAYTITVSNGGPRPVSGVSVSDPVPGSLLSPAWTCVASGGASCTASGSGSINDAINLPVGSIATYTLSGTLSTGPAGLSNTATAALPAGYADPLAANNSATDTDILLCGNETALVPDGRVVTTTLAPSATQWLLLGTHIGYSYSLEVQNRLGTSGPGTLTLFRGVDGCTGTSSATFTDTSSIDPAAPTTATRLAFTSSGADPNYHLRLTNNTASSIDYDLSLAETAFFSPAWSTNSTYNTYYSFQNTTGSTITATLTLTKTDGSSAGSSNLTIPAGATASTNTASLATARNATGTARLTHDGPPGALLAEAAIANFSTSPAYIQPVKFKTVREVR
jgi:uncharacterized repeat protein (TIGR01451 family)